MMDHSNGDCKIHCVQSVWQIERVGNDNRMGCMFLCDGDEVGRPIGAYDEDLGVDCQVLAITAAGINTYRPIRTAL